MNTQGVGNEVVTEALGGRELQPLALEESARDYLVEEGWNCIFSWFVDNKDTVPEELFIVLRSLNWLEFISREAEKNGGLIEQGENEYCPQVILALLNNLARLKRI